MNEMQLNFPIDLTDKNGNIVNEDDVIFNGEHYFRIYWNAKQPQVEAISPTYGYLHELTKEDILQFERVGTFKEVEHLLVVD